MGIQGNGIDCVFYLHGFLGDEIFHIVKCHSVDCKILAYCILVQQIGQKSSEQQESADYDQKIDRENLLSEAVRENLIFHGKNNVHNQLGSCTLTTVLIVTFPPIAVNKM